MPELITIALPKGKLLEPSVQILAKLRITHPDLLKDTRKLVFECAKERVRLLVVKPMDVPTYVEYGSADLGIVGKDVLLEQERDLYEPLDLRFGRCTLTVAEPKALSARDSASGGLRSWTNVRIATKYPQLTERYFQNKGIAVEVIRVSGAVELAPQAGLADRIVDLVDTGRTLKANGLVPVEVIAVSTARLIANRASLKTKYKRMSEIIDAIRRQTARAERG